MYFYSTSSHSSASKISHYIHRILGRRYALTATAYKYLDIGISVGCPLWKCSLVIIKAIRLYCLMQRGRHLLQNVLIEKLSQLHLHHCRFEIWL